MNPINNTTETKAPLSELEQKIETLVQRYRASRCEDVEALIELTDLLPDSDGEPLESPWHAAAIALLKDVLYWYWRLRDDFFVGGNMFIYYSLDRLSKPAFRGPYFFYVADVDRHKHREKWALWIEGGKYPDLIIEFLSPSTAKVDRTTKKELYERVWKTSEYFCYDPDLGQLEGWRLEGGRYKELVADERGWMWSEQLQFWLGNWSGLFQGLEATWLRFYDKEGKLVLLETEALRHRVEAAEEELVRLKERLVELERRGPEPTAPA